MADYSFMGKIVENLGTTGLIILVVWKLVDRWAGRFLEVQKQQAVAMADLAGAVKEALGEQREVLLAVRVMAAKVEETKDWVKELSEHMLGRSGAR